MAKRLLILAIVGALSVYYTVEAKPGLDENTKTVQVKEPQAKTASTKKNLPSSKNSGERAAQQTQRTDSSSRLINSLNGGSSQQLAKALPESSNSRFGIYLPQSSSDTLLQTLNPKLKAANPYFSFRIRPENEDYSLSDDSIADAGSGSENDYPINSGLTYALLGKDEKLSTSDTGEAIASRRTQAEDRSITFGIKPNSKANFFTVSSLPANGNQKASSAKLANVKAPTAFFALNEPKPIATASFGTGYEMDYDESQLGSQKDDLLDSGVQPTKGVSAAIPVAGGNFNLGVSYVVGRLNGIYRDKSDFSKRYAEFVDDKHGLLTLNLTYSHPIGKQTMWYGYAGYSASNKLFHNTEGLSNLFGGLSQSNNGYAVQFGVKHSF